MVLEILILAVAWWSEELAALKREMAKRRPKEDDSVRSTDSTFKGGRGGEDQMGIYRMLGRTVKRQKDPSLVRNVVELDVKSSAPIMVKTFYPEDSKEHDSKKHRRVRVLAELTDDGDFFRSMGPPPFTHLELKLANRSFDQKKAPSADGYTADICLHAINLDPDLFLFLLSRCLAIHHFP
ncbi:unnamed protein product [Euphydryas editha]|uniref:Uncharacterized protein n=1 Tax=Euphydryas editha TaxID=104508 RepID=A0AAU9V256_EUPED|nr:unnamed protein product [Euphydryas editha]